MARVEQIFHFLHTLINTTFGSKIPLNKRTLTTVLTYLQVMNRKAYMFKTKNKLLFDEISLL